ncbi:MAG: hypothetical protein KC777_05120 [Cyanobacteria bacterium HKST-UBA02]|nr:hypothetical protein [Cyanobacteria bacterium HKST-UBA02]
MLFTIMRLLKLAAAPVSDAPASGFQESKSPGCARKGPMSKAELIGETNYYVCNKFCFGIEGQSGICCTIGERDWIIGPITDSERFLTDLNSSTGKGYTHKDVFIDYEEGSAMFPDKTTWQTPANYPAMRVLPSREKGFPCMFQNEDMLCGVHEIKPGICGSYRCPYLDDVLKNLEQNL